MNKKENLNNISLYQNIQITSSITQTTVKEFVKMIQDYLIFCYNDDNLKENKHKQFLINRGLNMLYYIFTTIFMYTKNLEITIYHSKKAFYYYIEFLGQIIEQDNTYLQLTSKDAILFVYKKTIFEINNEYRKEFVSINNSCDMTTNIDIATQLYYNIISSLLNEYKFTQTNKCGFINYVSKHNNSLIKNILNLTLNKTEKEFTQKLNLIAYFNQTLDLNILKKIEYLNYFTKCLKKKNTSQVQLVEKLSCNEKNKYINKSYVKFTNWIFTNSP